MPKRKTIKQLVWSGVFIVTPGTSGNRARFDTAVQALNYAQKAADMSGCPQRVISVFDKAVIMPRRPKEHRVVET